MDVILDSNAYLSDIRMESIGFKNLFDYLRRTKCSLVLPNLVREETVAKYRHMLDVQAKKTAQAIENLNRLIISKNGQIPFIAPRSIHTARQLRRRFSDLRSAGLIRYYPDVTGVDVNDVFLRGVKRRRPANKEGEELRDVIIWLIALQYAGREKKRIALVTNDGGFWDDTEIHEHLKDDINQRKVNISLFRNIDDFIKSSAPEPKSVDEIYAAKVLDVATLADEITATTKKALSGWKSFFQPFTVQTAKLASAKFSSGNVYEIDPDTKFVELAYEISVVADLAFTERPTTGLGSSLWQALYSLPAPPAHSLAAPRSQAFLGMSRHSVGPGIGRPILEPPEPWRTTIKTYAVSAKAHIFVRLVKDVASEIELNRVEVNKAEEAGEPEEIPKRG